MKILLIILMLSIHAFGFAQLKPYGHIELQDYNITVCEKLKESNFYFPAISTKLGIEYTFMKRFKIAADSEVFSNYYHGLNLTPELAYYDFKFSFNITSKIKFAYSHRCVHEITSFGSKYAQRMFGGFDKIGIYYN